MAAFDPLQTLGSKICALSYGPVSPYMLYRLSKRGVTGMKRESRLFATLLLSVVPISVWASVPPPPHAPMADDRELREAIATAGHCFNNQFRISADQRFLADRATRRLRARPGSPEWLKAKEVVVAYLNSRRALMSCILPVQHMQSKPFSNRDREIWHNAVHGWVAEYEGQTRFQLSIVEKLIDQDLGEAELERPYLDPY
jgi:hypothetical protein